MTAIQNNLSTVFKRQFFRANSDDSVLPNPDVVGPEEIVSSSVKVEHSIDLHEVQYWRVDVENEVPFVWNHDILPILREHLVGPLRRIRPQSQEAISAQIACVVHVSTSDTVTRQKARIVVEWKRSRLSVIRDNVVGSVAKRCLRGDDEL